MMRNADYSAPRTDSAACASRRYATCLGVPENPPRWISGQGWAYQRLRPGPLRKVSVLVIAEIVPVVFGGLVPGFLFGLLAFRVKSRWCPRCGESTEAMHRAEKR